MQLHYAMPLDTCASRSLCSVSSEIMPGDSWADMAHAAGTTHATATEHGGVAVTSVTHATATGHDKVNVTFVNIGWKGSRHNTANAEKKNRSHLEATVCSIVLNQGPGTSCFCEAGEQGKAKGKGPKPEEMPRTSCMCCGNRAWPPLGWDARCLAAGCGHWACPACRVVDPEGMMRCACHYDWSSQPERTDTGERQR